MATTRAQAAQAAHRALDAIELSEVARRQAAARIMRAERLALVEQVRRHRGNFAEAMHEAMSTIRYYGQPMHREH